MGRQRKYFTEEERLAAAREHQRAHRQRKREAALAGGLRLMGRRHSSELVQKEYLWNTFRRQGCSVCGETFPGCIDAHHVGEKLSSVSELVRFGTLEALETELAKCIPLCANCHRKLHAGFIALDEGDHEGEKRCNQCLLWLPLDQFELRYAPGKPKDSRRSTCRVCRGQNTHGVRSRT